MNMIEDDAGAAFDAAYAADLDAAAGAVSVIVARSPHDVDRAARMWMDRCLNAAGLAMDDAVDRRVMMISDDSPTGLPEPTHTLPLDVRWAGSLFTAYLHDDCHTSTHLWQGIPAGQLHLYVLRLLTTMATTVRAYHEDGDAAEKHQPCCGFHAWLDHNQRRVVAEVAKAHQN